MTPPKKPEWFEIAESDGGIPRRRIKRGVRVFALSIPLLAIGVGVVLAQTSDESPASADSNSVVASTKPSVAKSSAAQKVVTSPSQPAVAKPSIAVPPTGGGDDDGYENNDEGDDD